MNPNAPKDGYWDASRYLGNRNQYNEGSSSWRAYEYAYAKENVRQLSKQIVPRVPVNVYVDGNACLNMPYTQFVLDTIFEIEPDNSVDMMLYLCGRNM
jgi:hypothetical protein